VSWYSFVTHLNSYYAFMVQFFDYHSLWNYYYFDP